MNITSAQYVTCQLTNVDNIIRATINGEELLVPVAVGGRYYDEIMDMVEAGTLTIQDAD
jgi:hypothetical protein